MKEQLNVDGKAPKAGAHSYIVGWGAFVSGICKEVELIFIVILDIVIL